MLVRLTLNMLLLASVHVVKGSTAAALQIFTSY